MVVCNDTNRDYVDMVVVNVGIHVCPCEKAHSKCYFCLSELLLHAKVVLVYAYCG